MSEATERERVRRALDLFTASLWPVIDRSMADEVGPTWENRYIGSNVRSDFVAQMRVIQEHRWTAFKDVFSKAEQNWLFEIRTTRNAVAHGDPVSFDDAYRAIDTMERTLRRHDASAARRLQDERRSLVASGVEVPAVSASAATASQEPAVRTIPGPSSQRAKRLLVGSAVAGAGLLGVLALSGAFSDPDPVQYPNCAAARAAGAAPLKSGEPGYRVELDGDRDGWACE